MKKLLTLSIFTVLFFTTVSGQLIPNGDFSVWGYDTIFERPLHWSGSFDREGLVFERSTDSWRGNYSIRLNSLPDGNYVEFGVLVYGEAGPMGLIPNPFNQLGDSLHFWHKAHYEGNDYGMMLMMMYSGGTMIDSISYDITASPSWSRVSFPVNPSQVVPDSVFIAFTSSRPDDWGGDPAAGSWLMVDHIHFTLGADTTPIPLPNHKFEDWMAQVVEEPVGWYTSNSTEYDLTDFDTINVSKTTDAHSPPYAVRLEVKDIHGHTPPARLI